MKVNVMFEKIERGHQSKYIAPMFTRNQLLLCCDQASKKITVYYCTTISFSVNLKVARWNKIKSRSCTLMKFPRHSSH